MAREDPELGLVILCAVWNLPRTTLWHPLASYRNGGAGSLALTDETSLRAIRRKVDWRIFPILSATYLVQNLDKFALNYAAVMGLPKDLHLKGNDFTNAATAFSVAFIVAEIPNIYLLQRVPAAKWLAINVFLWGIATACTAAATDFRTLLVARIFLAIFEATTIPSSQTITAQWYTKSEAAPRYAFWFSGNAGAQFFGGLISFGLQHMTGADLSGWRTMFLVFGLITLVVGVLIWLIVPDTPMDASFLTDAEKVSLLTHTSVNKIGVRNVKFKPEEIWEASRDPQVWIYGFATICFASTSGIITTYSATLIKNMGFTSKQAALLNMPAGIVSITSVLVASFGIRYTPGGHRYFWISLCALTAALGAGFVSFLPRHNKAGLLAGIWLINAITATLPMVYHYLSVNIGGHTKRSFTANLVAVCFGIGNIIGPQSFRAKDAPEYTPAKIVAMATEVATAVLMFLLAGYYVWENRRRDRLQAGGEGGEVEESEREAWKGETDRRNSRWRYMY
ncbi:putative MFS transporter [Amniculicola lignicola CBS 123094]|uniref:Putative MFS transporter n=1 Tax=Amniculicola lignicola CBS 123094 TaxID=1392246 RepID=A0A6A5W6P2_9PLEO|nr:putative MFS transporter [Amniculicola lignicola CBS 123094]